MASPPPRSIMILGAAGLIGAYLTSDLRRRGFQVLAVARHFPQGGASDDDLELSAPVLDAEALAALLTAHRIDIVVNCIGILQDSPGASTADVHTGFARRLIAALQRARHPVKLIQISVPGRDEDDATAFSQSKRAAERLIEASDIDYVILRPGFVIAPAAFGGSALMRALAALPLGLPDSATRTPFTPVAIEDVSETVAAIAGGTTIASRVTWELMQSEPATLADVIAAFRRILNGPPSLITLPSVLLTSGAKLGDAVAWLGWAPPIRTNALKELLRGVTGAPQAWISATGIAPRTLQQIGAMPATIQDKWFARLFLIKPLIIVSLVLFWCLSGLIALTISFDAAAAILANHNFPPIAVGPVTALSSLIDISVGVAIAFRRTCRVGLIAGIVVSLGYMGGSALLAPDLWIEPLGALVKTGPAIVLMVVAALILDDR